MEESQVDLDLIIYINRKLIMTNINIYNILIK